MSEFIFGFSKFSGYTITYQIFDYTERDVYTKEYDVNGQKLKTKRYSKGRDITNNSSNVYTYTNSC